ncbi:hypothetical protein GA0115234_108141 [Streptomyces sp. DvalAA-43]|nr:hypothetical protein GA0115234_108141 [Streptomyces sp. DvalAA-43]
MRKATTATAPFTPMHPNDVSDAFACIRAVQAHEVDTICAAVEEIGPQLRQVHPVGVGRRCARARATRAAGSGRACNAFRISSHHRCSRSERSS